jgi:amino-acid N-acetyltransferase
MDRPAPSPPTLRAARLDDVPTLAALIASADLPPFFIAEYIDGFAIAERDGAIVACGGIELYGDCGVLRSIVVAEEARGLGLGRVVSERLIEAGRTAGVTELYLFTMDAHDFWVHLGFRDVPLRDWSEPPRASWQYQFIAANPNLDEFARIHSMWRGA